MSNLEVNIEPTTQVHPFHTLEITSEDFVPSRPIRKFNLNHCMRQYRAIFPSHADEYAYRLSVHNLPVRRNTTKDMSPQEATFWIHAMTNESVFVKWREDEDYFQWLGGLDFNALLDREGIKACFDNLRTHLSSHYYGFYSFSFLALPIRVLLGFAEGLSFLMSEFSLDYLAYFLNVFGHRGKSDEVDEAHMALMVGDFAANLNMQQTVTTWHHANTMLYLFNLGPDQSQLIDFLDIFAGLKYKDKSQLLNNIIYKIEDDELYKHHLKAAGAQLSSLDVQRFLNRLGMAQMPYLMSLLTNRHNKRHLPGLTPSLAKIHSKDMVESLLDMSENKQTSAFADAYLLEEGANAVAGLLDQAERRGKKRDQSTHFLRQLVKLGKSDIIQQHLEGRKDTFKKRIEDDVLHYESVDVAPLPRAMWPDWMGHMADAKVETDILTTLSLDLPILMCEDLEHKVPDEVIVGLLAICQLKHRKLISTDDKNFKPPRASTKIQRKACKVLPTIRDGLDARSAGDWVWALFTGWVFQNAPESVEWSIFMLSYLGTPVEAANLEPYLKSYKNHFPNAPDKHAKYVLDVLKMMDIPTSWGILVECSKKMRSKKHRAYAHKHIKKICKEKSWDMEMFLDASVPTYGLNTRGSRTFDYGPRTFDLTIKSANIFGLIDSEGTVFQKVPPRRKTDDKEKVASAKNAYKAIVKQIKKTFEVQKQRLEHALIAGKSWPVETWKSHLLTHPLMQHLTRTLIWDVFDEDGEHLGTVLPTDDNSCLDIEYEPFELPSKGQVKLFHPFEADASLLLAWSDILTDFDIIQPFSQVGRATYTFQEEDAEFIHTCLGKLYSFWYPETCKVCEFVGWPQGENRYASERVFVAHNILAILTFDVTYWRSKNKITIKKPEYPRKIMFFQADKEPSDASIIRANEVPPVVYSEVLLSIHTMMSMWKS